MYTDKSQVLGNFRVTQLWLFIKLYISVKAHQTVHNRAKLYIM